MKYKAVIFDLDGTLLDTLEDLADSMNSVLSSHGFPEHPVQAYRYFVGDGIENLVRRTVPPELLPNEQEIAFCLQEMRETYRRGGDVKTHPYEGIPDLLNGLSQMGVSLSILSNKPHELTTMIVRNLLPEFRFDMVIGERPPVPRKPDPAGALFIAGQLGLLPEDFLYAGDTATDMLTAVAAKMHPVGVLWGFRTAAELDSAGAAVLVEKPAHILDLF